MRQSDLCEPRASDGGFQGAVAAMIKEVMNKRVAKQVIREFWFPFVAAIIWTFIRVSPSQPDFVASLIANFSASFFFVSWALSQLFRIARHQDVEDWFKGVVEELVRQFSALNETLTPVVSFAKMVVEKPTAEPDVRALAAATLAAAAQVSAANTVLLHARQLIPVASWYDQSNTPMAARMTPNPEIYKQASELFPHRPPDKPPETATGGSG